MGRYFRVRAAGVIAASALVVSPAAAPLPSAQAVPPTVATSQAAVTQQHLEFVARGNVSASTATTGIGVTCNQVEGRGKFGLVSGNPRQTRSLTLTSLRLDHSQWPDLACKGPGNMKVRLEVTSMPLQISLATLNPTVFPLTITGTVTAQNGLSMTAKGSDGCDMVISGSGGPGTLGLKYTYMTDRMIFTTPNNLHIAGANAQCDPTLVKVGDQIKLAATLQISLARVTTGS